MANGDEGSLFGHREVARQFVWSSADRTVVVRAFEKRAEHRMAATRVGKSGRVEQRYERVLSSEEWGRLEQAIAEADLVHMRPVLSLSNPHGNVWALEVADQTSYRVVVRTDPEPSFRNACTAFLQIDANYISQGPVD